MSNTNSSRDVKRKNSKSSPKNDKPIDYSDLDGLAEHPLTAVRRGLYAKHLKTYREAAGYSHSSLARALGVPPQSVYKWENGLTGLSPVEAQRIGRVLKVDAHLFYDDPFLANPTAPASQELATPFNEAAPVAIEGARWWRVDGSVLQHQGVLNGDLVAVMNGHHVADGDLALLAAAAADGSTWNTLRLRTGGYFVGHGPATPPEPIPHEPGSVAIRGTAIALFRPLAKMGGEGKG